MRLKAFSLFSLLVCIFAAGAAGKRVAAPTKGGVWPLPQKIVYQDGTHIIDPRNFNFTTNLPNCEIVTKAMKRYQTLTFAGVDKANYKGPSGTLTSLFIQIDKGCDNGYPYFEMDEFYTIYISPSSAKATLSSNTVWGMLRGIETFSQLAYHEKNEIKVRMATLTDSPRFPHRGVMIDSARHFLSVGSILENLDIMAQNKMNVLHWHLVDSESFPYTSKKFPEMTKGAYTHRHIYSLADVQKVISYARDRGIRVVPEFDTVGHLGAWGAGRPALLSKCYNSKGQISELSNILDPTKEENRQFIKEFFEEVADTFPDSFIHFGGDEVSYDMTECWQNNPDVRKRYQAMGMKTTTDLLKYYYNFLFSTMDKYKNGTSKIMWQDVIELGVQPGNAIAHVWKGGSLAEEYGMVAAMTKAGHKVIFSSCWYLNYIKYGADWGFVNGTNKGNRGMYYECDPTDFQGTEAQKKLVVGGEAALWSEFVDSTNIITRLWPRASAVAERLWSNASDTKSAKTAWPRLHEFRCRLLRRGFAVEPPMGPSFCEPEIAYPYKEL